MKSENLTLKRLLILVIVFLVVNLTVFGITLSVIDFNNKGEQSDNLSGSSYMQESVLVSQNPNPRIPYFIGFEILRETGMFSNVIDYTNDYITNYVIYDKKIYGAKVSFVKDSLTIKNNDSDVESSTIYNFEFGINDTDVNKIEVESFLLSEKVKITITDNNGKKYSKSFTTYSNN